MVMKSLCLHLRDNIRSRNSPTINITTAAGRFRHLVTARGPAIVLTLVATFIARMKESGMPSTRSISVEGGVVNANPSGCPPIRGVPPRSLQNVYRLLALLLFELPDRSFPQSLVLRNYLLKSRKQFLPSVVQENLQHSNNNVSFQIRDDLLGGEEILFEKGKMRITSFYFPCIQFPIRNPRRRAEDPTRIEAGKLVRHAARNLLQRVIMQIVEFCEADSRYSEVDDVVFLKRAV